MSAEDNNNTITVNCAKCDRVINVSTAVLTMHGGEVVCPQCLHHNMVAGYEFSQPATPVDSPVAGSVPESFQYCFSCGLPLPAGIEARYCPYCGTALSSLPGDAKSLSQPSGVDDVVVRDEPVSRATAPAVTPQSSAHLLPGSFLPTWFAEEQRQPASLRFRIVAGCVIILLLTVLIYLMHAIASVV